MMPIAHMSLLWLYLLLFRAYGGIYTGDPTLYLSVSFKFYCFTANPKSPISRWELRKKIFAGLRSRWTMPKEYRLSYPLIISLIILMASVSLSFFFDLMSFPKSPPSQKSVMM